MSYPGVFHSENQDGKAIPIRGNGVRKEAGLRGHGLCKERLDHE